MKKGFCILLLSLLVSSLAIHSGCKKKDKADTDPSLRLSFSVDTIFFDTVFTTIGSVTKRLMVYNPNPQPLRISEVRLAGGKSSVFTINIDGDSSLVANDIDIPGNDSLFVFIRATLDPTNLNLPFLVSDSILFTLNGNLQQVQLVAWGQNARFFRSATLNGIQVWDSLLPYVIYSHVRIDTGASLLILPGTRVYFHKSGYLVVSADASLKAPGTRDHRIWFQGDRLDPYYRDLPGQWTGILLEAGSKEHEMHYAVIKNGTFGLLVDEPGNLAEPMLQLHNTEIRNMTADAIFAYGSSMVSTNCVISNCGGSAIRIEKGGSYDFRQLTIGNYWASSVRFSSSLSVRNYSYDTNGVQIPGALTNTFFGNAIIYGSEVNELYLDELSGIPFDIVFDHASLKTTYPLDDSQRFIVCFANEDPLFIDPYAYDLRPDSLSPVIGKGIDMGVPLDINGNERGPDPDLGAYQWIPSR